jgi:hypothetical protein
VGVDGSGIRQRWLYGLRLLRDPQAISQNGNGASLRHGVAEQLVKAAAERGLKLSAREIRYRLQCARTYPTEFQIGNAITDFGSWFALIQARFPVYEAEPDGRQRGQRGGRGARKVIGARGARGRAWPLGTRVPNATWAVASCSAYWAYSS